MQTEIKGDQISGLTRKRFLLTLLLLKRKMSGTTPTGGAVATLKFSNQKNGVRGALIHHHALSHPSICPVKALTRRVAHLHANKASPDTLICAYFDHLGKEHIRNNEMLKLVRAASVALNLESQGFPAERLRTHSLRAGGAMAIAVNGELDRNIKKMGRWSTDTFLMYIHEQISHLTKRISANMSKPFPFFNVEGSTMSTQVGKPVGSFLFVYNASYFSFST